MPREIYPRTNEIYTFADILKLTLDDAPFLRFNHEEKMAVIQTAHVTDEQLLSIPGFDKTQWRYQRTTHEWIPLFLYAGEEPITNFVTIEDDISRFSEDAYWVCPKGFYREQYKDD